MNMQIYRYFGDKLGFISFIAFLLFMGLFYQVAWQYPVIDSFPLIERLLDSKYLINDFYTNTFNDFSPRLILSSCIAWLSEALNIHYTYVIAYTNIIRIWAYAIGLYLFYRQLASQDIALIAFALSSLSFLSVPFLPAWWPVTFDLTASNVALVFAMFAWVLCLKKKIPIALLLLTCATVFHPLVGVHSAIITAILFISYHGLTSTFLLFKTPSVYVAGFIFLIVFIFFYSSFDKVLTDVRFIEINAIYRHSHHFILSHMDIEKWASTGLMLIISFVLIFRNKLPIKVKHTALAFFAYGIILAILGYILIEILPTRFMVSFIPLRAFPILVPMVVIVWAYYAQSVFKQKNYLGFLALILPFLPYHQFGLTWFLFPNHHELTLPIIVMIAALIFTYITTGYPKIILKVNTKIDLLLIKAHKTPRASALLLPIGLVSLVFGASKFEIHIPNLNNQPKIYQWIKDNTSPSDVLLTELNGASNQKIRLLSKRAIIVSKDFPFNEHFYEQWYNRYKDVYTHKDIARGHIDSLNADQLNTLMDRYKANILIRTITLKENPHFQLIGNTEGEKAPVFIYRNHHLVPQ